MITTRGWWFLIIVLSLLTVGLFDGRWSLSVLGLTLTLWFFGEWVVFLFRVTFAVPEIRIVREVRDDRGPVDTLWARRSFRVRLEVQSGHWLGLPYVQLKDYIPQGVLTEEGEIEREGVLSREAPLSIAYTIRCPAPGRIRFEGVGFELADIQGFFYRSAFLPGVARYRVLPPLADAEGHRPTVKRHNLLPSPGLHRHFRPGSGSELLDLRDYLPGDPPKTIAWKVSARRDRLITKEFESEVPVRCTLFIDTSHSVRIGPPGQNSLTNLVEIGSAIAQANSGARDLTGICLFDEHGVSRTIRPGARARHLVQLLNILADAAGLSPATGAARVSTLLPLAHAFVQEVYPHLLRQELNHVPPWLPWLWPLVNERTRRARIVRRLLYGLFVGLAFLPVVTVVTLVYLMGDFFYPLAEVLLTIPGPEVTVLLVMLVASFVVLYYAVVNLASRPLALLFAPNRRRLARWRKRLAAVLAERYGLGPGGVGLLLEDDERFSLFLQRFLADHHVPYPLPFYDRQGRYLFASPGKIDVLSRALLRAVGKGHDNELFVLLVDLVELVERLEPVLRAVKVALARHHQVVLLCPWPPGVPVPAATQGEPAAAPAEPGTLPTTVREATTQRLHQAYHDLRRTLARLGVPVACVASGDPVRLVLERLDRLRALGTWRRR